MRGGGPAGRLRLGGLEADFVLLARLGAVLTALLTAGYLFFAGR